MDWSYIQEVEVRRGRDGQRLIPLPVGEIEPLFVGTGDEYWQRVQAWDEILEEAARHHYDWHFKDYDWAYIDYELLDVPWPNAAISAAMSYELIDGPVTPSQDMETRLRWAMGVLEAEAWLARWKAGEVKRD